MTQNSKICFHIDIDECKKDIFWTGAESNLKDVYIQFFKNKPIGKNFYKILKAKKTPTKLS